MLHLNEKATTAMHQAQGAGNPTTRTNSKMFRHLDYSRGRLVIVLVSVLPIIVFVAVSLLRNMYVGVVAAGAMYLAVLIIGAVAERLGWDPR